MPKKKKIAVKPTFDHAKHVEKLFATLEALIEEHANAAIAESWKGGGDPEEIPVFEAQLQLARAKLNTHLIVMRREFK